MKRYLITFGLLAAFITSASAVPSVQAHVLLMDTTKTKGAVMHITPDDDPVTGQPATIYLDMQNNVLQPDSAVALRVSDQTNQTTVVTGTLNGTLALFDYTFPSQGAYKLSFTVTTGEQTYTFLQSQRISRGTAADTRTTPRQPWAEILLTASFIAVACLAILIINRRHDIARQSRF